MSAQGDDAAIDRIAHVAHEAVRAWAVALGQPALPAWEAAEDWMIASTRAAVRFRLEHPDAPPSAQHDQWMAEKRETGWAYGPVKDADAKTHPLMVPYAELPEAERRKDALIQGVIDALGGPIA